jgi:hypothetical protein
VKRNDPRDPSTAIGRALASIPEAIRYRVQGERLEVKPEKPTAREATQAGLFGDEDEGAPYWLVALLVADCG